VADIFEVAAPRLYRPEKPVLDVKYRSYIRSLKCCVPNCRRGYIEAAHTGPHGIGQKSSDRSCIPLCAWHHRTGPNSLHQLGPVKFQEHHKVSISVQVEALNIFYRENLEGK